MRYKEDLAGTIIGVRLNDEQLKKLNYITNQTKRNRSAIIKEMIDQYYNRLTVDGGVDKIIFEMKRAILSIDDLTRQIDTAYKKTKE